MIEHQRWLSSTGKWTPCPMNGDGNCVYDVHRERPAPKRQKGERKAREWDVYVSKDFGSQLLPHNENAFCGNRKCCELIRVREVMPPAWARGKK